MVAKSYQNLKQIGEPFTESGRQYVYVEKNGDQKKVRWYTDKEYQKMYPDTEPAMQKIRPTKEVLGFANGYIMLVKGEDGFFTGTFNEWLRFETEATFRTCWGWAFESGSKIPDTFPEGLSLIKLTWEQVADVEKDELKPSGELKQIIDSLLYPTSVSEYQGEIGERITRLLTVKKAIQNDGYYGMSTFHIFEDEEGNQYTWTTSAKNLPEGDTYYVKGTIKQLSLYKGQKQTILTRCKILDKPN